MPGRFLTVCIHGFRSVCDSGHSALDPAGRRVMVNGCTSKTRTHRYGTDAVWRGGTGVPPVNHAQDARATFGRPARESRARCACHIQTASEPTAIDLPGTWQLLE